MAIYKLPVSQNAPWYQFNTTLAGNVFELEMLYNVRCDRWFLNISDASANIILAGICLLIERDFLAQYPTLPLPDGALIVLDNTGAGNQPGLSSFLTTHGLYFLT